MEQDLYCRGKKLDAEPARLGTLRDSSDIVGDERLLQQRMSEDGYLLFRGLVNREKVLRARREILLKYAIIGEIDAVNHDVMDAILQEQSFIAHVNLIAFTESIRRGVAYDELTQDTRIMSIYEKLLGGKVRTFSSGRASFGLAREPASTRTTSTCRVEQRTSGRHGSRLGMLRSMKGRLFYWKRAIFRPN
ncbi:hypothetical protein [Gibbsiella quercinecans]|uniref:hypothetical protein n=1 Tax=Gibbsiella quercinecans TaxID=929813 RepID=UPI002E7963FD|nr:hypothetical protein [Gibbsiella quercinecans]